MDRHASPLQDQKCPRGELNTATWPLRERLRTALSLFVVGEGGRGGHTQVHPNALQYTAAVSQPRQHIGLIRRGTIGSIFRKIGRVHEVYCAALLDAGVESQFFRNVAPRVDARSRDINPTQWDNSADFARSRPSDSAREVTSPERRLVDALEFDLTRCDSSEDSVRHCKLHPDRSKTQVESCVEQREARTTG